MMGTSRILHHDNWDVAAYNYRFCTDKINLQLRMYHSGATDDLGTVIDHYISDYDEIVLVGFSLGGNLVLKYCGENGSAINTKISKVAAISVPVDLGAGSINISQPHNFIYQKNFLSSLTKKIKAKHQQFPNQINLSLLKQVKTLFDFDNLYTGPIHGFNDALDYYAQCSSKQFLRDIKIPCLILNAQDDPFLPEECYPTLEAKDNALISLLTPKYGGHVGFVSKGENYWDEKVISQFLSTAE